MLETENVQVVVELFVY